MELNIPAIQAIGGAYIYLVDRYGAHGIYDVDFVPIPGADEKKNSVGLTYLDHLTHNLHRGNMAKWADYYERIFNFREIRYFDIEGKQTGLLSKAMTSPDGKIRIPLNESRDDKSQIEEFLRDYNGEGIQHIALGTDDIYDSVEALRARHPVPDRARHLFRRHRPARRQPWRGRAAPAEEPHPDRRRADAGAGPAAADLHHQRHRPDLLRVSSSARAMKASARATSAPCSNDRGRPDQPRRAEGGSVSVDASCRRRLHVRAGAR